MEPLPVVQKHAGFQLNEQEITSLDSASFSVETRGPWRRRTN